MANLQSAFDQFHRQIALTAGNKIVLRMALEGIRGKISKHFRDILQQPGPKFNSQGSYAMSTLINPINGEYNLNEGVHLHHLDNQDSVSWPTGKAARQWLIDAFKNFGRVKILEKNACVRLRYVGLYNVDLPLYGMLNGRSMLAMSDDNNWSFNDPHAMTQWFDSHFSLHGEQLRRIIRYVKAWADFQSLYDIQMPNGFVLSVLVARHYQDDIRDDVAMAYTLKVISKAIIPYFSVLNPVNIDEELSEHFSQSTIDHFCDALKLAAEHAVYATRIDDTEEASMIWRKLFGSRFPISPNK